MKKSRFALPNQFGHHLKKRYSPIEVFHLKKINEQKQTANLPSVTVK